MRHSFARLVKVVLVVLSLSEVVCLHLVIVEGLVLVVVGLVYFFQFFPSSTFPDTFKFILISKLIKNLCMVQNESEHLSPAIASDVASDKLAIASDVASDKSAIASDVASNKSVITSDVTSDRRSYCQRHTASLAILLAIGDVAGNVAGDTGRRWQHHW